MYLNGDGWHEGSRIMRTLGFIVLLLATLFAAVPSYARGGQAADDCPPNSKDPDCAKK